MRIVVVQVDIPIQSYTRDLVNGLSEHGCEIELLTRRGDFPGFIDPASLKVPIRFLEISRILRFYIRLRAKFAQVFNWSIPIQPSAVHRKARQILDGNPRSDLLIGIEKTGLEIVARYGRSAGIPFIYYSLELYIEDHPELRNFGWQRGSEIAYHRDAAATIIQDRFRWESLRRANTPLSGKVYFVPVGVCDREHRTDPHPQEAAPLHTVLYLGMIRQSRFARELLDAASRLPENMQLHLHGPLTEKERVSLGDVAHSAKAKITTDLLTETSVRQLVAGAYIGLALYRRDCDNDRLTAFASQKIALYLREGIPIIAFRSEAYEELFRRFRCGELIESIDELNSAVERISNDRDTYKAAAHSAYAAIYNLDVYWPKLVAFLDGCRHDDRR